MVKFEVRLICYKYNTGRMDNGDRLETKEFNNEEDAFIFYNEVNSAIGTELGVFMVPRLWMIHLVIVAL